MVCVDIDALILQVDVIHVAAVMNVQSRYTFLMIIVVRFIVFRMIARN